MLRGGCHCGRVRYEAAGAPRFATICHCRDCRRASSAPCVAWFTMARAEFRIIAGAPAQYRSSDHAVRGFCGRCGAQISFAHDDLSDEIDITTASLDDPSAAAPRDHIHTISQLSWHKFADGLARFEASRETG